MNKVLTLLGELYSHNNAPKIYNEIARLSKKKSRVKNAEISEKDAALITYADSIVSKSHKPLKSLELFIKDNRVDKSINTLHILPFYPWDTDRGFSVINYRKVNDSYGNWSDIKKLSKLQNLMFDFVANHISIDNPIAQESLIARHVNIKTKYKDFLLAFSEDDKPIDEQLKNLARPRPNPVLTPYFITKEGSKFKAILGPPTKNQKSLGGGFVWTTFSRPKNNDYSEETRQVDLNFANPKVLIESIKILLFYIEKGAKLVRLDAIGYIWKKIGSTSLHEKEAHKILQIINLVLKKLHPEVTTIAEINEQQDKVIEYLGNDKNPESDMVYQFTHFPLAIYSILKEDARSYQKWYESTKKLHGKQFITVLGSHDGLGLKPVRNILTDSQIDELSTHLIKNHKALPNHAHLPGGKQIVYEICATPWNLINSPQTKDTVDLQIKKYLAVVAMGLTVRGLPAFYINGLIAAKNYTPKFGLDENRTVNREKLNLKNLEKMLSNKKSVNHIVMHSIEHMLNVRKKNSTFNPSTQFPKTVDVKNNSVFALKLFGKTKRDTLISLVNISDKEQKIQNTEITNKNCKDLLTNQSFSGSVLNPYQVLWLKH